VSKASHAPAVKIILRSIGGAAGVKHNGDTRYVGRLLEGVPLVAGDRVAAMLFGSRYQDFEVAATQPKTGA